MFLQAHLWWHNYIIYPKSVIYNIQYKYKMSKNWGNLNKTYKGSHIRDSLHQVCPPYKKERFPNTWEDEEDSRNEGQDGALRTDVAHVTDDESHENEEQGHHREGRSCPHHLCQNSKCMCVRAVRVNVDMLLWFEVRSLTEDICSVFCGDFNLWLCEILRGHTSTFLCT